MMPVGVLGRPSEPALIINAMAFKHTKFPNAAKEYLRFMMEAEQYDRWLSGCLGYWSQPLKAYAESKVWSSDPKLAVFRNAMDTPYYEGFAGPIGPAMGAAHENWVVVDMFARVVTGEQNPQDSMRAAARAARETTQRSLHAAATLEQIPELTSGDVVEWWADTATIDDKRRLIDLVIDHVTVKPRRGNPTVSDRLDYTWRD